jgi:nitroreductase
MIKAIEERRSIRNYLNEDLPEEKIEEIVRAAFLAPSANAIYPWDLVIVKKKDTLSELSKVTPWSSHIGEANVVIAIVGRENDSKDWIEDCSIVAEHIWLEATEQGLGSCWTQIRGNDTAEKEVKKILNIPDEDRVLCLMPLGVPANISDERLGEEVDKSRVKYDKYR